MKRLFFSNGYRDSTRARTLFCRSSGAASALIRGTLDSTLVEPLTPIRRAAERHVPRCEMRGNYTSAHTATLSAEALERTLPALSEGLTRAEPRSARPPAERRSTRQTNGRRDWTSMSTTRGASLRNALEIWNKWSSERKPLPGPSCRVHAQSWRSSKSDLRNRLRLRAASSRQRGRRRSLRRATGAGAATLSGQAPFTCGRCALLSGAVRAASVVCVSIGARSSAPSARGASRGAYPALTRWRPSPRNTADLVQLAPLAAHFASSLAICSRCRSAFARGASRRRLCALDPSILSRAAPLGRIKMAPVRHPRWTVSTTPVTLLPRRPQPLNKTSMDGRAWFTRPSWTEPPCGDPPAG